MAILTEKEYSYGSCKGTNSTNHFTKQHSQRGRCLFSSQRKLQRHPSGTYGSGIGLDQREMGGKYPYAISNWENNWGDVNSFFQFSDEIRRIMYTTNIIEGVNRQYRKVTDRKSVV